MNRLLQLVSVLSMGLIASACQEGPETSTQTEQKSDQFGTVLEAWANAPRTRIMNWMEQVTDPDSKTFIPIEDRIAVFDNDGTLWPEQPMPNQLQFALDYLRAHAGDNPEWQNQPVLRAAIAGDFQPVKEAGLVGLAELINASHTEQTVTEFDSAVRQWIDTARNEKFDRRYQELVYLPMLQLLDYLRAHKFKTFIVSGGGADFMRVWTEEVYGIPPYQVIGSYGQLEYTISDGKPTITKVAGDIYLDDKTGKPIAIRRFIGKKPVFCGGNSDGDQAMMQYTTSSPYQSFCVLLHHTDGEREYAYDTKTLSGHLESALLEAEEKDWLVVDMANDFKTIFPAR